MSLITAKQALDKIIDKARVHFYKPIQIAELLYRDRVHQDINLAMLETYRTASRKWRDIISIQFLGTASSSSARYQDDIFNDNAVPPSALVELGTENKAKNGIVEAYIYQRFLARFTQMSNGLDYCTTHNRSAFNLEEFINLFWAQAGLKRSIDKIYEIVVYALFSALVEALELSVQISFNPQKKNILQEFSDFSDLVLGLNPDIPTYQTKAKIYRMGVTNAADKGLDMWANFGLAIQIKHLSLNEEMAEDIVSGVSADRIVIVCKEAEQKVIVSLLNQLGWKSKIQSIITEKMLINWYDKALRGIFGEQIGSIVLQRLANEITVEFPTTEPQAFQLFYNQRNYHKLNDSFWSV